MNEPQINLLDVLVVVCVISILFAVGLPLMFAYQRNNPVETNEDVPYVINFDEYSPASKTFSIVID